MKNIGLDKINVYGSRFETGFGYSEIVKLKLDGETYLPVVSGLVNVFGVPFDKRDSENIFCSIVSKKNFVEFYSKCDLKKSDSWILGATTLRVGESIWGTFTGPNLGKIKNYKKLKTKIDYKLKIKRGFGDFAYDLWLTKSRNFGKADKDTVEIMIVLEKNFNNFLGEVIEETEEFQVRYQLKENKSDGVDNGHTFAFILKNKKLREFDILKLVNYCERKLKKKLGNYHLRSIDLVNEFSYNTEMKVDLKKLSMGMEKKLK
jgi:hypothetical protein